MSRCVRPRQEWGRGQNTRMGGSDPTVPQNRGPIPSGSGGHSRLLLLRKSQPVFWPRRKEGIGKFVRQEVRQNCKGGIWRKHGNHQATTKTTKVDKDSRECSRIRENAK